MTILLPVVIIWFAHADAELFCGCEILYVTLRAVEPVEPVEEARGWDLNKCRFRRFQLLY